jgi:hypothetical protein
MSSPAPPFRGVGAVAGDQDIGAIGGELHGRPEPQCVDDVAAAEAINDDAMFASKPEIVTSVARPDTVTTPLLLVRVANLSPVMAVTVEVQDRIAHDPEPYLIAATPLPTGPCRCVCGAED